MRKSKRWLSACLLTLILCLGVFCTPAMADNSTPEPTQTPQPENGVEVTVSEDGTYTVSLGDWEWTFGLRRLQESGKVHKGDVHAPHGIHDLRVFHLGLLPFQLPEPALKLRELFLGLVDLFNYSLDFCVQSVILLYGKRP